MGVSLPGEGLDQARDHVKDEAPDRITRRAVALRALTVSMAAAGTATPAAQRALRTPDASPLPASQPEQAIRTEDYGIRADGHTDDTAAWRAAFADVVERGIGRLIFSGRGPSIVSAPIIDGHAMPPGITLVGEGRNANNDYVHDGPSIVYTGRTGALFDIRQPHGAFGAADQGRWTFQDLSFIATEPDGSLFSFQNPDGYAAVDGADGWSYVSQIRFANCHLRGSMSRSETRTGDGIKAAKTFYLWFDPTSIVEGFRYGIRLDGCDDCLIEGRAVYNACHVRIARGAGWFGNNNRIAAPFLGPILPTRDAAHHIDDGGRATIVDGTLLEQEGALPSPGSFLRIAGDLSDYRDLRFSSGGAPWPIFTLGSDARECLLRPRPTAPNAAAPPIIEAPRSWDFGQPMSDHRLRVVGAGSNARGIVGDHPRIWYGDDPPLPHVSPAHAERIVDINGARVRHRFFNALHYWALNYGSAAAAGSISVKEAGRWLVRMDAGVVQSGINLPLREGTDFVAGDRIEVTARLRVVGGSTWAAVWTRKGHFSGILADLSKAGHDWLLVHSSIATTDWKDGEELAVLIYNLGRGSGKVDIDAIAFSIGPPSGDPTAPIVDVARMR